MSTPAERPLRPADYASLPPIPAPLLQKDRGHLLRKVNKNEIRYGISERGDCIDALKHDAILDRGTKKTGA